MLISILSLSLLLFSCSSESYKWFDGSLDQAFSLIEDSDKIVFLDFYSDG